jgi:hypothetical protein
MKILNKESNSEIYKEDFKDFTKFTTNLNGKKNFEINIFCSFAYLTPNYTILFTLEELRRKTKEGKYKIFIVFWDMNSLANPYFKKDIQNKKIKNPEEYINEKIKELKNLIISIGFKEDEFIIYKSSEVWRRLIYYPEENLFQNFYSILSNMNIEDFKELKKASNTFQVPLDIFFCNYLPLLFPEDISDPIDIAFLGYNKLKIYNTTRKKMKEEGLIKAKKPLFLLLKDFPYLNFQSYLPEMNMSLKEISEIVQNCDLNYEGFISLMRNILFSTRIKINNKEFEYYELINYCKNLKLDELKDILSNNLHSYLKNSKERYFLASKEIKEDIKSITNRNDLKNMGGILRSDIAIKILLLSDGTKNTTDIAKDLQKSVPTISMYANKLKKLNLIRVLENHKLKRNIKGIKINFDLGVDKNY